MKSYIVTDLGYGDSGKGAMVANICQNHQNENKIVIRTSGGHQVGHTVYKDGKYHEFHSFGSGTLENTPTYYHKGTTMFPAHLLNELELLKTSFPDVKPELIFHCDVMVTTSYDVLYNRYIENQRGTSHGSVGLGFGATIERSKKIKFTVFDIMFSNPLIIRQKLTAIKKYYSELMPDVDDIDIYLEISDCINISKLKSSVINNPRTLLKHYDIFIFEGNQGVLLDMDYGMFPNVTRSYTTCKTPIKFIKKYLNTKHSIEFIDVNRIYHTRHGNGEFAAPPIELINNKFESNKFNDYQGRFKTSPLQIELLLRGIECNTKEKLKITEWDPLSYLVFTCCDQLKSFPVLPYMANGVPGFSTDISNLIKEFGIRAFYDDIYYTDGPAANKKKIEP